MWPNKENRLHYNPEQSHSSQQPHLKNGDNTFPGNRDPNQTFKEKFTRSLLANQKHKKDAKVKFSQEGWIHLDGDGKEIICRSLENHDKLGKENLDPGNRMRSYLKTEF